MPRREGLRVRVWIPALLAGALAWSAAARAERLPIRVYTADDGLMGDEINTILQDSRGFLWIGTDTGLSRFDGTRFVGYDPRQGLPSPHVTALAGDPGRRPAGGHDRRPGAPRPPTGRDGRQGLPAGDGLPRGCQASGPDLGAARRRQGRLAGGLQGGRRPLPAPSGRRPPGTRGGEAGVGRIGDRDHVAGSRRRGRALGGRTGRAPAPPRRWPLDRGAGPPVSPDGGLGAAPRFRAALVDRHRRGTVRAGAWEAGVGTPVRRELGIRRRAAAGRHVADPRRQDLDGDQRRAQRARRPEAPHLHPPQRAAGGRARRAGRGPRRQPVGGHPVPRPDAPRARRIPHLRRRGGDRRAGRRRDLRGQPVQPLRLGRRPVAREAVFFRRRAVAGRDAGGGRALRRPGQGPPPGPDAGRERRDLAGRRGGALAFPQGRQARRLEAGAARSLESLRRDGGDLPPVRGFARPPLGVLARESKGFRWRRAENLSLALGPEHGPLQPGGRGRAAGPRRALGVRRGFLRQPMDRLFQRRRGAPARRPAIATAGRSLSDRRRGHAAGGIDQRSLRRQPQAPLGRLLQRRSDPDGGPRRSPAAVGRLHRCAGPVERPHPVRDGRPPGLPLSRPRPGNRSARSPDRPRPHPDRGRRAAVESRQRGVPRPRRQPLVRHPLGTVALPAGDPPRRGAAAHLPERRADRRRAPAAAAARPARRLGPRAAARAQSGGGPLHRRQLRVRRRAALPVQAGRRGGRLERAASGALGAAGQSRAGQLSLSVPRGDARRRGEPRPRLALVHAAAAVLAALVVRPPRGHGRRRGGLDAAPCPGDAPAGARTGAHPHRRRSARRSELEPVAHLDPRRARPAPHGGAGSDDPRSDRRDPRASSSRRPATSSGRSTRAAAISKACWSASGVSRGICWKGAASASCSPGRPGPPRSRWDPR